MLCLTHISSRYAGAEIREQARAVFAGAHVLRDFDTVEVPFPSAASRASSAGPSASAARARSPSFCPDRFSRDPLILSREARKERWTRVTRWSSARRRWAGAHAHRSRDPRAHPIRSRDRRHPPSRAFLAQRLHGLLSELLGSEPPLGDLDIGFYRDDVASRPDAPWCTPRTSTSTSAGARW